MKIKTANARGCGWGEEKIMIFPSRVAFVFNVTCLASRIVVGWVGLSLGGGLFHSILQIILKYL